MSMMLQGGPFKAAVAGFRRFTVAEYHKMIAAGVLTEDDRIELLEGYLVEMMPHDPIHDGTVQKVSRRLTRVLPAGWEVRVRMVVTLPRSEPESDIALVREDPGEYMTRHPGPADFGIVAEVSNTSLDTDRDDKLPIYARAGLPEYWIVNVIDRQVEVYTHPSGPTANPGYGANHIYKPGDSVPLVIAGNVIGPVPVNELLT